MKSGTLRPPNRLQLKHRALYRPAACLALNRARQQADGAHSELRKFSQVGTRLRMDLKGLASKCGPSKTNRLAQERE